MAKPTSTGEYLKTRVYRVTKAYVLVCGLLLVWLNLRGLHFSFAVSAITLPEWVSATATALLTTAVALIDAVPGDHLKAALVFWRWTNPLPGSRAFERAYLDADHRIAVDKLKAHLEGKFPRAAKEQNATWYRLYKTVQNEPEVSGTHYEYLLFRDLAWFTSVLAVLATVTLLVNSVRRPELATYAGVSVLLYALFARAAFVRGHRFVRTVLAVVAARPVETKEAPPKLTQQAPL